MSSNNEPGDTKRLANRSRVNYPCSIIMGEDTWFGTVTDLSLGGAFIESGQCSPNDGESVEVRFEFAEREAKLSGTVRHSGRFLLGYYSSKGFGVEFDTAAKCRVALMLREHKPGSRHVSGSRLMIER